MVKVNYNNLSKEVSYALRHAPWEYELEIDEGGWVSVSQLINTLHLYGEQRMVTEVDLEVMIEESEKKRHEICAGKIRALYGHSIPMRIKKEEAIPPKKLYHGTSPDYLESIIEKGLLPMSRQYVHLSEDIETALIVGKRKNRNPIILVIDTESARDSGFKFYLGNEKVWLAKEIPKKFIEVRIKS